MKQLFKHNGYSGSVETSVIDECLHGKILFINDLVTYEAQSMPELNQEFKNAVDDYLLDCKKHGVDPDKTFNGVFNVRISKDDHRKLSIKSHREGININKAVSMCISDYLNSDSDDRKTIINISVNKDNFETAGFSTRSWKNTNDTPQHTYNKTFEKTKNIAHLQ